MKITLQEARNLKSLSRNKSKTSDTQLSNKKAAEKYNEYSLHRGIVIHYESPTRKRLREQEDIAIESYHSTTKSDNINHI